tara:strand:+ start:6338 stop:8620 length:2283 start_codon:yes stop_codon:yes gene_type:complete
MILHGGAEKRKREEPEFTPEQREKARELIATHKTVPAALTEWKKMDNTLPLASKMRLLMEANRKRPRVSSTESKRSLESTKSVEECPYCQEAIKDTDKVVQCVNGHRMHASCYCESLNVSTWHDSAIDTMGLNTGDRYTMGLNMGLRDPRNIPDSLQEDLQVFDIQQFVKNFEMVISRFSWSVQYHEELGILKAQWDNLVNSNEIHNLSRDVLVFLLKMFQDEIVYIYDVVDVHLSLNILNDQDIQNLSKSDLVNRTKELMQTILNELRLLLTNNFEVGEAAPLANVGKCPICRQEVITHECLMDRIKIKIDLIHPELAYINGKRIEEPIALILAGILKANKIQSLTIIKTFFDDMSLGDQKSNLWYRLLNQWEYHFEFPLDAFTNNTSLTDLHINYFTLPVAFANTLGGNRWRELDFGIDITDSFVNTMVESVNHVPKHIDLRDGKITTTQPLTPWLRDKCDININYNPLLRDKGFLPYAMSVNAQSLIETIDIGLQDSKIVQRMLQRREVHTSIKVLTLKKNYLEDLAPILEGLVLCTDIESVDLSNNQLTLTSQGPQNDLQIYKFDISFNQLDGMGVKHLRTFFGQHVRKLNISNNPIGDEGAFTLASMKHLIILNAEYCNITSKGATALIGSGLQGGISVLDLANNLIEDMQGFDLKTMVNLEDSIDWEKVLNLSLLYLNNNKMDQETFDTFLQNLIDQFLSILRFSFSYKKKKVNLKINVDRKLWYENIFQEQEESYLLDIHGRPDAPASACTMM